MCDNQASVRVMVSGRAKNRFMQSCLREIVYITATEEVEVFPVHIEGCNNRDADLLSRWHLGKNHQKEFWDRHKHIYMKEKVIEESWFKIDGKW